jgi:hypothetical protein
MSSYPVIVAGNAYVPWPDFVRAMIHFECMDLAFGGFYRRPETLSIFAMSALPVRHPRLGSSIWRSLSLSRSALANSLDTAAVDQAPPYQLSKDIDKKTILNYQRFVHSFCWRYRILLFGRDLIRCDNSDHSPNNLLCLLTESVHTPESSASGSRDLGPLRDHSVFHLSLTAISQCAQSRSAWHSRPANTAHFYWRRIARGDLLSQRDLGKGYGIWSSCDSSASGNICSWSRLHKTNIYHQLDLLAQLIPHLGQIDGLRFLETGHLVDFHVENASMQLVEVK